MGYRTFSTFDAEIEVASASRTDELVLTCARRVDKDGQKVLARTQEPTVITLNNSQKLELAQILLNSLSVCKKNDKHPKEK